MIVGHPGIPTAATCRYCGASYAVASDPSRCALDGHALPPAPPDCAACAAVDGAMMAERGPQLERELAEAVLAVEPEKREGGSAARQRWMRLVLNTQMALLHAGFPCDVYRVVIGDE